jgi:hypothetical protein
MLIAGFDTLVWPASDHLAAPLLHRNEPAASRIAKHNLIRLICMLRLSANSLLLLALTAADDSCCPDGFDCFTDATGKSTCEWTGSPVIPPSGASFNAKVKPARKPAPGGRNLHTIDDAVRRDDQPQPGPGGRKLKQLINSCASTTLPVGMQAWYT